MEIEYEHIDRYAKLSDFDIGRLEKEILRQVSGLDNYQVAEIRRILREFTFTYIGGGTVIIAEAGREQISVLDNSSHEGRICHLMSGMLEVLENRSCDAATLVRKANLDTNDSAKYVNLTVELGLLAGDSFNLRITDKGRKYLEEYRKLRKLI